MPSNLQRVYNVVEALNLRAAFERDVVALTSRNGRHQIASAKGDSLEAASGALLETLAGILTVDPREEK